MILSGATNIGGQHRGVTIYGRDVFLSSKVSSLLKFPFIQPSQHHICIPYLHSWLRNIEYETLREPVTVLVRLVSDINALSEYSG